MNRCHFYLCNKLEYIVCEGSLGVVRLSVLSPKYHKLSYQNSYHSFKAINIKL